MFVADILFHLYQQLFIVIKILDTAATLQRVHELKSGPSQFAMAGQMCVYARQVLFAVKWDLRSA